MVLCTLGFQLHNRLLSLQAYHDPMLKLSIMTEQELNQIFGTLDSLIPLHEGEETHIHTHARTSVDTHKHTTHLGVQHFGVSSLPLRSAESAERGP